MSAALNRLGSELFGSLGQLSVELAALAVLVLLAGRLLRIQSPALRHFLCNLKTHLKRRIPIMKVFAAVESDLALRIRRVLGSGMRRMGVRSRVLAAILLCGVCGVTLPYTGIADAGDGVDWETVKSTPPEEWSEELKEQIAAGGHDVEAVAERVRQWQVQVRDKAEPDLDVIGRRIRAAVERGDMTPEEGREKMEAVRQRQQADSDLDAIGRRIRAAVERGDMTPEEGREKMEAARQAAGEGGGDRLREFQRGVVARAMAEEPEEWSDELKAEIVRAGWDLEEFTEGIRKRQAAASASGDPSSIRLKSQGEENTAVEESSWGRIKEEHSDSK